MEKEKVCPDCGKELKNEEWYDLEDDCGIVYGFIHNFCKGKKQARKKEAKKKND